MVFRARNEISLKKMYIEEGEEKYIQARSTKRQKDIKKEDKKKERKKAKKGKKKRRN